MNTIRSRTARTHSARFADVRRSSSMIPILSVDLGQGQEILDLGEELARERRLLRVPCILGLTM